MAQTSNSYTVGGSGQAGPYSYSFPTIADADVKVSVNGTLKTVTTHYTLDTGNTRITFVSGQEPSTGDRVIVYRDTDEDPINSTFVSGSTIRSNELNDNFQQLLFIAQESDNQGLNTLGGTMEGTLTIGEDQVIKFEGATANANETTLTVVDPTADRTITLPNVTGTVVTTGDTGTVATAMIANDAITNAKIADNAINDENIANLQITTAKLDTDAVTGAKIADNAIDSEHYVDLSIDEVHLNNNIVSSSKIINGAVITTKLSDLGVTTQKIANDAITNAKIADNAINDENIADLQITTAKLDNNSVTTAKVTDSAITNAKIANQTISGSKLVNNTITTTQIAADAVTGGLIADNAVDSEHYVDGSIDTAHIADAQITEAKLGANAVTTAKINGGAVTEAKLATSSVTTTRIADDAVTVDKIADGAVRNAQIQNDAVNQDKIADNAVRNEHILADAVNSEHYAAGSIDAEHIADNAVTTAKIADAELTTLAGMQSGTASILASSTALTSTTAELNLLDGKSIVTTISGSPTDAQLPTAQAVDERITTVVTDVGGFVPIANETSFPSTNPDVNDGAGTIVSIKALSSAIVCGSGVTTKTIANGAGSGNTVTINGLAQNTTYPAGRGMLVETTSTLHTYTYHRLTLDESGVADAQAAVDDFQQRYRVASSAPTSSLDDGDLYFDTTVNKMKVYNASSSSWDDVAAPGDFYIATFSQSFDGSRTAFTVSNAPTSAQQLLISINGVIQKPNAGTGQPSEGFTLSGSTVTFSSAPPTGSDYHVVVLGSSVNIGTPSDNTVATAKIQNGAVTEEKLSISNGPQNGYFLQTNGSGTLTWAEVDLTAATDYGDNTKVRFGTGNDLEIFHDGSNSYITEASGSTPGDLRIQANNLKLANWNGGGTYIYASNGGSVDLYYDNSKKFETVSAGAQCIGQLIATTSFRGNDNVKLDLGSSQDLQIYHDGTHSRIHNTTGHLSCRSANYYFNNAAGTENCLDINQNGAVKLYYDHSNKFETVSYGVVAKGSVEIQNGSMTTADSTNSGTTNSAIFGTGSDLKIYHDGSHSYVLDDGTGELRLTSGAGGVRIMRGSGHTGIFYNVGGQVELYYDNSKKFETTSAGVAVSGNAKLYDGNKVLCGHGDDLQIFHDGSHSYIHQDGTGSLYTLANTYRVNNEANSENMIAADGDGAVELYYNGIKRFETTTGGAKAHGNLLYTGNLAADDDCKIMLGTSDDLQIYHNGSTGKNIYQGAMHEFWNGAGNEPLLKITQNSYVQLYYDDSEKFRTESYGAQCLGEFFIGDGSASDGAKHLRIGNGGDMRFWHDGSNSHFANYHGAMHWQQKDSRSQYWSTNDSWRIELDASGHFKPYTNNASDLGTSSKRWRNIYTNDLNLSNKGSSNEVDGTWGNYTIQEGEDDLFLINRRNGKKYKFNLTEVN